MNLDVMRRKRKVKKPHGTCWVAARCATEAFSTTSAVHIEDCEDWWSFGCCGSVAEHWRLKPEEVSWVRLPATASFFTFLYFRLITSKFTLPTSNMVHPIYTVSTPLAYLRTCQHACHFDTCYFDRQS